MPDYGKLLKTGATSLGKSMLSGIAKGAISMILTAVGIGDSGQLDKIQAEIHSVSLRMDGLARETKAVQTSIDRLGTQLSHVLLELKMDHIEDLRSRMDSTHKQVAYVLKSLTEHLTMDKSGQINTAAAKDDQAELLELLNGAKRDFPGMLETFQKYMEKTGEDSILELASLKVNDSDPDIITYYFHMVAFMAPFWLAQKQAIGVLATIMEHPELHFVQGNSLIADYNQSIQRQDELFKQAVGPQLCDLVEELIRSSELKTMPSAQVNLYNMYNRRVVVTDMKEAPFYRDFVCRSEDHQNERHPPFRLQANFDWHAYTSQPSGYHYFQLFLDDNERGGKLAFEDTDIFLETPDKSIELTLNDLIMAGYIACLDDGIPNNHVHPFEEGEGKIQLTWKKREGCFGIEMAGGRGQRVLISKRRSSLDFERMRKVLEENPWPDGAKSAFEERLNGHYVRVLFTEGVFSATDWLFMSQPNETTSLANKWQLELVK
ncbi:hypothetical protein FBEOM_3925 [Fusarium beomiforme]|uniref:Uncharacterized protein n=1 Tax=Fusarium beomiforme TaxID=44412 RepID=A0A9P5ANR3_9HYPO|nr:hypothetical protein FBEOM_3925 [Fusarium beomiforme]